MAARDLDDARPLGAADLVRGETDTGRVAHRLGHVVEEMAQSAIEPAHGHRRHAQDRVSELDDREDGHRVESIGTGAGLAAAEP